MQQELWESRDLQNKEAAEGPVARQGPSGAGPAPAAWMGGPLRSEPDVEAVLAPLRSSRGAPVERVLSRGSGTHRMLAPIVLRTVLRVVESVQA